MPPRPEPDELADFITAYVPTNIIHTPETRTQYNRISADTHDAYRIARVAAQALAPTNQRLDIDLMNLGSADADHARLRQAIEHALNEERFR